MKEERFFISEKSTKNTMRYEEVIEPGKPPLLRNIYVQSYSPLSKETVLKVTVEDTGLSPNDLKK